MTAPADTAAPEATPVMAEAPPVLPPVNLPFIISLDRIRRWKACDGELSAFRSMFPNGVPITVEAGIRAQERNLQLWWSSCLLTGPQKRELLRYTLACFKPVMEYLHNSLAWGTFTREHTYPAYATAFDGLLAEEFGRHTDWEDLYNRTGQIAGANPINGERMTVTVRGNGVSVHNFYATYARNVAYNLWQSDPERPGGGAKLTWDTVNSQMLSLMANGNLMGTLRTEFESLRQTDIWLTFRVEILTNVLQHLQDGIEARVIAGHLR